MTNKNIIGYSQSAKGAKTIKSINPQTLEELEGNFALATEEEIELAMQQAHEAWKTYRDFSGKQKGAFLRAIAEEIEALGDDFVQRVMQETALPEGRVKGERGRTCGQLRMFAGLVEEGSWVEVVIDTAKPDRQPVPKPDIRRMLIPVGPVVVFTASNFPQAFSTAGGDTASALAAGCPVIVKAHESHLGTNTWVAEAISRAAAKTGMPDGVFSSLNGQGFSLGQALVKHPLTRSVAFTGSFRGGKALYDLAQQREDPIPVFAEMGSVNPVFLLPGAVREKGESLAQQIAGSVNMGVGQFCTNPGVLVALQDEHTDGFVQYLKSAFTEMGAATMLNSGIYKNYENLKRKQIQENGVKIEYELQESRVEGNLKARPAVASVSAKEFLQNPDLHEEVFGPFSILVLCEGQKEMEQVASVFEGQLTASFMSSKNELANYRNLASILREKVGRLIFNGVPTGVEVCPAMHHGGPFPATTDNRYTSVGTGAIKRFARPVAFQDWPDELLREELKDGNPLGIYREVH